MTDTPDPDVPPPAVFEFRAVPEVENGVYANISTVWSTGHEFTVDFAVTQVSHVGTDADGKEVTVIPANIVARIKLPPTVLFDVMRDLSGQLDVYEDRFGPIRRPGEDEPVFPPDDQLSAGPGDADTDPDDSSDNPKEEQ